MMMNCGSGKDKEDAPLPLCGDPKTGGSIGGILEFYRK